MADAHRAEAVREVSESVLGQAEAEVRQLWGSSEPKRGWSRPEVPMRGMRDQAESTEVSGGFREAFEAVGGVFADSGGSVGAGTGRDYRDGDVPEAGGLGGGWAEHAGMGLGTEPETRRSGIGGCGDGVG